MTDPHAKFQGSIPAHYDRHLGPVIFEPYAVDLARRVGSTAAGPVLEIACGTGIVTRRLRQALAAGTRLVATDLNQAMIDYARTKPELATLQGIEWQTADAAALPFASASFSAVACQFGFMFVPDKNAAFREARRVLAPGGRLAFNVWDSFAHNAFARTAHETIAGFFASNPPGFYLVPFGFHDAETLRDLLAANDFGEVALERVTLEARSTSARSFATGLVRGNPVSITIQERGQDMDAVIDALTAALTRVGGAEPFRSSIQAIVVTARAGVE